MPYPTFDRSRLRLRPLAERAHDLTLDHWLALDDPAPPYEHPDLPALAQRIRDARDRDAAVILLIGGHVIRAGVARHLIDLLERGLITHLGMNGAAAIHDYELALIGATTESVARYIREGQFGLWAETGGINDIVAAGVRAGLGMGEAIGGEIAGPGFPHRSLSVLAACYRLRVPATVHIGLGYDIIHEHPNCDGAALGAASYRDFLILAQAILGEGSPPCAASEGRSLSGESAAAGGVGAAPAIASQGPRASRGLEGGVVLNLGTAVMGPEVLLKALAMARNVAHQEGREIARFTSAVFDLLPLGGDLQREAQRGTPEYYFRPYKTLLVRTVAGGGQSYYLRGDHRLTVPALWRELCR